MPIDILMPALSPTMEKGTLAKWLKKEGDAIKSGDVLAEIETDKATMEVEAVDEGVLAKIVVPEGSADVPVNKVIGLIAGEGEDIHAAPAAAKVAAGSLETKGGRGEPSPASPPADGGGAFPAADDQVLQYERPGATAGAPMVTGTADAFKTASSAAPSAAAAASPGTTVPAGGRTSASPLARRIAKQAGLDLAAISGSGPNGRIVERDVRAAEARGAQPATPAPAPRSLDIKPVAAEQPAVKQPAAKQPDVRVAPAPAISDETIKAYFTPGSYDVAPHDGMRRTIARRLSDAAKEIPHYFLTLDCEIDALLSLREQINSSAGLDKDGKPRFKASVNDFIIKGLATAFHRVPDINATWTEGAMLRHRHVDIGVAVSIPSGLITPIVRKAETKTISAISIEMKDFAARAKARKLKPEEYQGGVTAVSNLGMYGIKHFTAVINPPQSTILAVGMGEKRVVVKNGAPAVATVMTVTLSVDHRVADGALGARLIEAFKQVVEAPLSMLA